MNFIFLNGKQYFDYEGNFYTESEVMKNLLVKKEIYDPEIREYFDIEKFKKMLNIKKTKIKFKVRKNSSVVEYTFDIILNKLSYRVDDINNPDITEITTFIENIYKKKPNIRNNCEIWYNGSIILQTELKKFFNLYTITPERPFELENTKRRENIEVPKNITLIPITNIFPGLYMYTNEF